MTSSLVRGSNVETLHESTPRTPLASSRIIRIVRPTSRLAVTARPASRSARVPRAPLLALKPVGGRLDDVRPLAVEEPDTASAGADQRRYRETDPGEDRRHVEARGDELAGRVERRQLVGAAAALVGQARLLDPQG